MQGLKLAAILLFSITSPMMAQEAPGLPQVPSELEIGGIAGLVGDKLKEVKGAALVTWAGKPGAGAYLPIWTWKTAAGTPIAEFPAIGYRAVIGSSPDAFTTATLNIPGLSAKLFGSQWIKTHITKSVFPPTFFGPAFLLPLNLQVVEKIQWKDWTKYAAIVLSVRVAAKPLEHK